jgi:hypothetical protein
VEINNIYKRMHEYTDTENAIVEASGVERSRVRELLPMLRRCEMQLNKLNEVECSGDLSPAQLRTRTAYQREAKRDAKELGCSVRFNGDPRGAAIRLLLPDGRSNNWDGETWCMYF